MLLLLNKLALEHTLAKHIVEILLITLALEHTLINQISVAIAEQACLRTYSRQAHSGDIADNASLTLINQISVAIAEHTSLRTYSRQAHSGDIADNASLRTYSHQTNKGCYC